MTRITTGCMLAVLCATLHGTANAQPYFARAQVIAAPEANNDFVDSVDVDGEWAAAGGEKSFNSTGTSGVFIYRRVSGTWVPFQRLSCPVTGPGFICNAFGTSVVLSGTTLGVSAGHSNQYTGVVWIYEFDGSSWVLQTTLNPPSGKGIGDWMALDGNYLVTGEVVNNSSDGWSAAVYERNGSTWTRQDLLGTDRTSQSDRFGLGVGVSPSRGRSRAGEWVCVVAPGGNPATAPGSVHVFRRSNGSWVQEGPKLTPSNLNGALTGGACAIDDDDTLLVGAPNLATQGQPGSGRVFVYARAANVWTLQQTLVADGTTHGLGASIAVSGEGAIVGANQSESVHLFASVSGSWVERGRDQNPLPNANLGDDVATDGSTFMVGGGRTAFGVGVLAVYVPSNTPPNPTGPPTAPTGFQASVSGNTVSFSWVTPIGGGVPTSYALVARTIGGALLTTLPVGPVNTYSVVAPNGVFRVSIRAANPSGAGPESAPVTVTVPAAVPPPGAPAGLAATVSGTSASFTWSAPASGSPPTGYTLVAGTSPGFTTPIATLQLPASPRGVTVSNVPPGTYYVRIHARNGGSLSGPSNEVPVTIAGPTVPGAPVLNPASVTGRTVALSWTPGLGGTPSSYVLTATTASGAVLATVPLAATSATFPNIASGTYLVRVAARNAVGTGPASNTITVVVP